MPCFQLSMGVWASNCVLIHLRTYGLRTDGLLEETNAHALKTDTFITCNSFRVYSSRLPKLEYLPRNGAGANQSSAVCTYFLCYQNLNLPRNGGCQPIKMRTVHICARAYVRVWHQIWTFSCGMRDACTCWWKVIKTSCSIWDHPGTNWPPTDGRSNPLGNLLLHECMLSLLFFCYLCQLLPTVV